MDVYRDTLRELREEYFVTYQPADARFEHAIVNLVFFRETPLVETVATAMENEARHWLRRFPVPAMIFAFDPKDDLIDLTSLQHASHLTGLVTEDGKILQQWGGFPTPPPRSGGERQNLAKVYHGIGTHLAEDVRRTARRNAKRQRGAVSLILFLIVGVPLAIQIAALGIEWFGYVVSAISLIVGGHKAGKLLGWIRPSEREKAEAAKQSKMEHYFDHCERNLDAFQRLKLENFERDAIEHTRVEADDIRKRDGGVK